METQITRFDYVNPIGGNPAWCVEVTPIIDGPFKAHPVGPLTPEQAEEQFGLTLESVLGDVTSGAIAEAARARAALNDLHGEHSDMFQAFVTADPEAAEAFIKAQKLKQDEGAKQPESA